MAGTIIADKIQTENSFLTLNVGQTLVATINSSGILNSSGGIMVGANGSVSNTAIAGFINGSQIANGSITASQLASPGVNVQVFTSSSGTYTVPAGTRYLLVEMCAGGGGGGGSNSAGGSSTGGDGGNSTFGTSLLTCNAGTGGSYGGAGIGGTATVGSGASGIGLRGGYGAQPGIGYPLAISGGQYWSGGHGGSNSFGGAGQGSWGGGAGVAGATNTGAGGGGGGSNATNSVPGTGGGSGGYIKAYITSSISATYSYAVGAGGTAGAAGTNGFAGGAGAAGIIVVTAFF